MYRGAINSALFSKAVTLVATVAVVAGMILPFAMVHAASSNYSFTMTLRVVDGCDNNEFHYLDAGTIDIDGSTNTDSNQTISHNLQRDRFGPNKSFGTVNASPDTSFSGTFPTDADQNSSNYCLVVSRGSNDPWTVTGSGTLSNQ